MSKVRTPKQVAIEIQAFHLHLRDLKVSKSTEACLLPPPEIVPEGVIKLHGEEEIHEDIVKARMIVFVHRLINDHVETWRVFLAKLIQVRVAHPYLIRFTNLSPVRWGG